MKSHSIQVHNLLAAIAFLIFLAPNSKADTATGESGDSLVDTRGIGRLTLSGRVVNGKTGAGLAEATVSSGGQTGQTDATGSFRFANAASNGSTVVVQVSSGGFANQSSTEVIPATASALDLGTFQMFEDKGKPIVEKFSLPTGLVYFRGISENAGYEVKVNWNGHPPGEVQILYDDEVVASKAGLGPEYRGEIVLSDFLNLPRALATLQVVAIPAGGTPRSDPRTTGFNWAALPSWLRTVERFARSDRESIVIDWAIVKDKKFETNLFADKKWGFDMNLDASFDYSFIDGEWELQVGVNEEGKKGKRGRRPSLFKKPSYKRPFVYLGNKEIKLGLNGFANGTAQIGSGLSFNEQWNVDSFGLDVGVGTRIELGRFLITDLILPIPAGGGLLAKTGFKKLSDSISIVVWLEVGVDGKVTIAMNPVRFDEATFATEIGLEAVYAPEITKNLKASVTLGGSLKSTFGFPEPLVRSLDTEVLLTLEGKAWGFFKYEKEFVLLRENLFGPGNRLPLTGWTKVPQGYLMEVAGDDEGKVVKGWRARGSETFLLPSAGLGRRLTEDSVVLERFIRMGQAPARGAVYLPATGPGRRIPQGEGNDAEADLKFVTNALPDCEPSLAANGTELMMVYKRDTGGEGAQYTEIAWSRFDGTDWSAPQPIAPMANAQHTAVVKYDGEGDAVAVWEQLKDPLEDGSDLTSFVSKLEIVSSRWDSGTGIWSTPTALTDNDHLDNSPYLAGPLANGDLVAVWLANEGNELAGFGNPGAVTNSAILMRRWDAGSDTWGGVKVVQSDLIGEESLDVTAAGNHVVIAWTRDLDASATTVDDSELSWRLYDGATDSFDAVVRATTDAVADSGVRLQGRSDGSFIALWRRGGELVLASGTRTGLGAPSRVRESGDSAGLADAKLALGPGGNIVVIWQEMAKGGSDVHLRVFDPTSGTWGEDTVLSDDADQERAFSPVWDQQGNLVIAYENAAITYEEKTVELVVGGEITIDHVPTEGQVDLHLVRRALVRDLEVDAINAEGETFQAGEEITLRATLKNSGNVAIENPALGFYDGDPAAGGTLIATHTHPGWLRASEEVEFTTDWVIPAPTLQRTIYAIVDQAKVLTEHKEENNTASIVLGGVDLVLEYKQGEVGPDGALRVVATIRNEGTAVSPVCEMSLFPLLREGPLALATVPVSELQPGGEVELPIELPAGSQTEISASYFLMVDALTLTGDLDETNNRSLFSLSLWVDRDEDGMPEIWETANDLSDDDEYDRYSDLDEDGFTAFQEWLSGTDPADRNSFLRFSEYGLRQLPGSGESYQVSWPSVEGTLYNVERSYDMKYWAVIARNEVGSAPLNTLIDLNPAPIGKAFYRTTVLEQEDGYHYVESDRVLQITVEREAGGNQVINTLDWDRSPPEIPQDFPLEIRFIGVNFAVERSFDQMNWEVVAENIRHGDAPPFVDVCEAAGGDCYYRLREQWWIQF